MKENEISDEVYFTIDDHDKQKSVIHCWSRNPPLADDSWGSIFTFNDWYQPISFADDPEDRKDGILEVGGEEVSADEADPDYTEYMTGGS